MTGLMEVALQSGLSTYGDDSISEGTSARGECRFLPVLIIFTFDWCSTAFSTPRSSVTTILITLVKTQAEALTLAIPLCTQLG